MKTLLNKNNYGNIIEDISTKGLLNYSPKFELNFSILIGELVQIIAETSKIEMEIQNDYFKIQLDSNSDKDLQEVDKLMNNSSPEKIREINKKAYQEENTKAISLSSIAMRLKTLEGRIQYDSEGSIILIQIPLHFNSK